MPYINYKTTYRAKPLIALAGGGFALIVLVLAWLWLAGEPDRVRKPLPEMALTLEPGALTPAAEKAKPFKLVYRNSVIPGGVHSAAELAAAVQREPVVAAHYANFDVAAARLVLVEQSRLVHVSYRIGDNIYWTKKKVRLALGESLLSDGKHLVRARCGNRIADEPEGPVLDNEPAPETLEAVFVSADDLIDQAVNLAAVTGGVALVPAAASTTAATVAQPLDTRVASNMHSVAQVPAIGFPNSWNSRNPAQSAPALRFDAATSPPPVVAWFDANVLDTVGSGTPQEPTNTPPANPAPEGAKPQSTVTPDPTTSPQDSLDSKTPHTPPPTTPTPAPDSNTPTPDSPAPLTPTPTPQPATSTTATPTPVPEPGSAALVGLALLALMLVRRGVGRGNRARGDNADGTGASTAIRL